MAIDYRKVLTEAARHIALREDSCGGSSGSSCGTSSSSSWKSGARSNYPKTPKSRPLVQELEGDFFKLNLNKGPVKITRQTAERLWVELNDFVGLGRKSSFKKTVPPKSRNTRVPVNTWGSSGSCSSGGYSSSC